MREDRDYRRKDDQEKPPFLLATVTPASIAAVGCIILLVVGLVVVLFLLVEAPGVSWDPGHDGGRDATGGTHGLSEGQLDGDWAGGTSGRGPDDDQ